jgi:SAM-dependent methyltransferase
VTEVILEWRGYRYFEYERAFARLEVTQLFATTHHEDEAGVRIPSDAFKAPEAERLTYFGRAVRPGGDVLIPRQAQLEASALGIGSSRQATRYSAHGLHEYKGRFNPQVVRAIGNILGLEDDAWVLDPFCGSGTTLLECIHSGWNAVGVDRNPLAVRIANAKLRAFRHGGAYSTLAAAIAEVLRTRFDTLSGSSPVKASRIDGLLGAGWERDIPSFDYLSEWFPSPVLAQIVAIRRTIAALASNPEDRAVFDVVLSDKLRDVSLQEPLDLRIRRRKDPDANYPLLAQFLDALEDRIERIDRARAAFGEVKGRHLAILGDIRQLSSWEMSRRPVEGFDAVITSPPYETALPYIDTQRLSLVLFGDVSARNLQKTEQELIGAREISVAERRRLESTILDGDDSLPIQVLELCRELLIAASEPGNGFRRRNRPALTYRYFKNMAAFFQSVRAVLRPGAKVAMVVGTNRTILGGREYVIDTPGLLAAVGEHSGFTRVSEHRMNTYQRYDIHQRNSIEDEMLVVLSAP